MMRLSGVAFFLGLAFFSLAASVDEAKGVKDVTKAFNDADIPVDLGIKFRPSALLTVALPQSSGRPVMVKTGSQLPRNVTVGPPSFIIAGLRYTGPFVIVCVDPDAPTPQEPTVAQVRHQLAGNFYSSGHVLQNKTGAVTEWLQPSPPSYSSAHRYVFLLYKQPRGFNAQTIVTPETSLINFNISSFASVVGLGDPLAGTFMIVAPDA
ncbi:PEBP-like protein [Coprinopsis sp. MPI-PUGE-AT-0042]|nr:PEBP-like protein [Coprinopsis sp. MPI-PUGE-AT-0042]